MKLKLKTQINDIYKSIKENLAEILCFINCILLIVLITIWVFNGNDNNDNNNNNEEIELCSMSTDNNTDNYSKITSDYICLTSPIVKIGNTNYRCVGSLFLGYEGDICYLYYPVAYTNNNLRSYEYRRTVCGSSGINNIEIAVQNTEFSSNAVNFNFRFFIYIEPNNTLRNLKRNIYDINYFDYNCYVDDITPFDSTLNGYSTFSDYLCYSSNNSYRFLMRLYNVSNLSEEPNTYSINNRYNPCLHFNDFSGYELGFNAGYSYGYDSGAIGESVFDTITKGANSLLNIEIFPNFNIGECFLIMMVVILFGVLMKVFRF